MNDLVRSDLLAILNRGLLRIRAFASGGDVAQCFIEADHLHNIPELLTLNHDELLAYYMSVTRPCFISESRVATVDFEPFWNNLHEYMAGS